MKEGPTNLGDTGPAGSAARVNPALRFPTLPTQIAVDDCLIADAPSQLSAGSDWEDASPAFRRDRVGCELAAEVLGTSGSLRLRAHGSSMLPVVWPGDILHVHRKDAAEIATGDVVLYARQGRLIAHRVVDKRLVESPLPASDPRFPVEFVTRGDNMDHDDAPIAGVEILGRVAAIERGADLLPPRQLVTHKIAASILSRSDTATRLVTWMGRWMRSGRSGLDSTASR